MVDVVAVTVFKADGAIHWIITAVEGLLSHLPAAVAVAVSEPPANNS